MKCPYIPGAYIWYNFTHTATSYHCATYLLHLNEDELLCADVGCLRLLDFI